MYAMLRGDVWKLSGHMAVIDVAGVGYEVYCSHRCREQLLVGRQAELIVHTEIKEDSIKLYGFVDILEKQVFCLLLQVKGVGARSAADIISQISAEELFRAIGSEDVSRLQSVRGVGKKTAERIVVELKDKVAAYAVERGCTTSVVARESQGGFNDAQEALIALGLPRKEVLRMLDEVRRRMDMPAKSCDASVLVKEALRYM